MSFRLIVSEFVADIDECSSAELNKCSPNANCTNTIGSYTCECPTGYTLLDDQRQCGSKLYHFFSLCSTRYWYSNCLSVPLCEASSYRVKQLKNVNVFTTRDDAVLRSMSCPDLGSELQELLSLWCWRVRQSRWLYVVRQRYNWLHRS